MWDANEDCIQTCPPDAPKTGGVITALSSVVESVSGALPTNSIKSVFQWATGTAEDTPNIKCLGCGLERKTNVLSTAQQVGANTSSLLMSDKPDSGGISSMAKHFKSAVGPACECIAPEYSRWVGVHPGGVRASLQRAWDAPHCHTGCEWMPSAIGRSCPSCGNVFCKNCLSPSRIILEGYHEPETCCVQCTQRYTVSPRILVHNVPAGLRCLVNTVALLSGFVVRDWSKGEGVPSPEGMGIILVRDEKTQEWTAKEDTTRLVASFRKMLHTANADAWEDQMLPDRVLSEPYALVVTISSKDTAQSRLSAELLHLVCLKLACNRDASECLVFDHIHEDVLQCNQCRSVTLKEDTPRKQCACGSMLWVTEQNHETCTSDVRCAYTKPTQHLSMTLTHYHNGRAIETVALGDAKRSFPSAEDVQWFCAVFQRHLLLASARYYSVKDGHALFCNDVPRCKNECNLAIPVAM